jgi:hypothetical protein
MVPRAIGEYVSERKCDEGKVTPREIEALLDSKADELKGYTFLKHLCHSVRPIYPERQVPRDSFSTSDCMKHFGEIVGAMNRAAESRRDTLETTYQQVTASLEARWVNERSKLVPGSELLEEIFKTYGLRFVKLRDGPGLAAKLKDNEIDAELRRILALMGDISSLSI